MKKGLGVILCASLAFSLAGCGKQETEEKKEEAKKVPVLSCTASDDIANISYDFEYNENKTEITKIALSYQMDFKDSEEPITEEDLDIMANELCDLYGTSDTDCNKKLENQVVTISLDADVAKLEEITKDQDVPFKRNMNMDELKDFLSSDEEDTVCKEITK